MVREHDLLRELEALIARPSHRDPGPVLAYVQARLPFLPWQRQRVGETATGRPLYNLYARPPQARAVLNTHVDTVPPLGMRRPWQARRVGRRIYGRGAVDTKGLLAALVVAARAFWQQHRALPAAIALTVDEENTSALGSAALAPRLPRDLPVVVLEPTAGRICTRQRGALEFRLTARGEVVHAAIAEQGVNPIRLLTAWLEGAEARLGMPVHVLQFRGGWPHYAVPPRAWLLAEMPLEAGHTWRAAEAALLADLQRGPWAGRVTYTRIDAEDPLDFGEHPGVAWLRAAYRAALGQEPTPGVMPSWTDAANFAQAGLHCVVFGFGDLAVAHSPREHITLDDLARMARVLYHFFSILTQKP